MTTDSDVDWGDEGRDEDNEERGYDEQDVS